LIISNRVSASYKGTAHTVGCRLMLTDDGERLQTHNGFSYSLLTTRHNSLVALPSLISFPDITANTSDVIDGKNKECGNQCTSDTVEEYDRTIEVIDGLK
jgi:hypothetical protein